jgi:hypothetical protein
MAAPTQISVTFLTYTNASPTVISIATQVIPVPTALQNLDSGQTAAAQTGYNALDTLLGAITRRGGITFTDATGTSPVSVFIPLSAIVKITAP